uniref:MMS19 nucleotide excision repair protein n=1 Tax=Pseudo-nitzschia australis TaxID=44445 RepID=A0A7S4EFF4_9STRA|mmetsp:Transcript_12707/g.25454  ORF Transcript_12707/g.25454 Transcript_12707/m.25454 type:complete len:1016 (+) Transcript_12707:40-3087(+)
MSAEGQEQQRNDGSFQKLKTDVLSIDNDAHIGDVAEKTNSSLQQESKKYFQSMVLNHEEALAKLIKDLGPAFTSTNLPTRLRGLYVLLGAIEGCRDKNVSNSCVALLGDFLTLHGGPIADDEYEEDYDSMIRDISIQSLSALVETPTTTKAENGNEFLQAMERRVNFAKKGVERRCAAPDDMTVDDEMDTENDDLYYKKDIRGGLSSLPRSKRSLCFALLNRAVLGTSKATKSVSPIIRQQMHQQQPALVSSIQSHFVQFADFTARCIHGESDPRCLLQLLELLHNTQTTFCDWFLSEITSNPSCVFPNEDFFDAVAPYYPIQFTPPPNNVHGITREGLHSALISVLSFTKMDEAARQYRKPTMLGCSLNLFLEQLLPGQAEEENPSTLEKLESLECISNLLFPTQKKKDHKQSDAMESECVNISFDKARNLSTALITTHHEASAGVSREGGDLSDQNRVLAEACRNLASRVARELEKHNKNGKSGLWECFVSEPLDKEIKKLKLTPAYAKTSIAYEASLATSGGPRTLRACLAKGLGPLLGFLHEHVENSDDNTLAAIHGIAAFVSSSQVALSKSMNEGVELTPHPLQAFAKETCNLLLTIVESKMASNSLSLKTAAASCLECLFLSSLEKDLESDELLERICKFLKGLLEITLARKTSHGSDEFDEFAEYRLVSSKVLGRIIGVSLSKCDHEDSKGPVSKSVLSIPRVQDCLQKVIFPELQTFAFSEAKCYDGERYDRLALSTACSSSANLASSVVGAHLEALLHALKDSITSHSTQACLEALSYILQSCVGDNAIRAFHENEVVDDILDVLCDDFIKSASTQISDSISQVALSPTNTSKETMKSKIHAVISIERAMLPAYRSLVPRERLKKLLKAISDKVPPLSKADEGVLLVRLPILSAALQGVTSSLLEEVVSEIDSNDGPPVTQLLHDLTEYVLSDEHLSNARNAGALCMHTLLKSGFNRNLVCPTKSLLVDINNKILSSSSSFRATATKNCLNYLSLLVSCYTYLHAI